jgi:hypothetical protein
MRATTGEIIRALLAVIPTTYQLNEAVAWYKRWGRGKNWADAAEKLLADLTGPESEATKTTLRRYGVEL